MTVERFSRRAEPVRRARQILQMIQDDFSSLVCDRCLPNINIYSGLENAMPLVGRSRIRR